MKERIWEKVEIYGGSTSSCQEIGEIWYPSHGIFRQNAIELRA